MKKIFSLILALAVVITATVCALPVSASGTVTPSISLSSTTTTVGNQVKVTVKYTSQQDIGSWKFYLSYDSKYLQYVSGADGGAGGKVSFVDAPESAKKTVSYTVTFKTLKVGETTVKTETTQIVNNGDFTNMTVSGEASKKVKIAAKPQASTDATLKSLSVSPVSISPKFSSSVTDYTAEVDFSTARLVVSATPNHKEASVKVSGADALSVGENKVKITVTAESGATKTYNITVTRKASDLAGVNTTVNGNDYYFGYDTDNMQPPEGYTQEIGEYNGKDVITYVSPNALLTVVCLVDSEGADHWYTMDKETKELAPYVEIKSGDNRYALLDKPESVALPAGFAGEATDISIGDVTAKAYAALSDEMSDFSLVYAMEMNGQMGLYTYDSAEGTLQRFVAVESVPADTQPADDTPSKGLPENIKTAILFAVAGILLLGGIVVMVAVLKKPVAVKKQQDEE